MSAKNTPKAGETVYSIHGEMAIYVSRAKGGGHIVQPLIDGGDGFSEPDGQYVDGVALWPSVYREPPQPMLDESIAAQEARLAILRGEVRAMEKQKSDAEREQSGLMARLKQQAALRYVDDLIAGRLPPLCVRFHNYQQPDIVPVADALNNPDADRSYREPATKLLTLFGNAGSDLQWRLNRYHDGSGHWETELYFVSSQDEGVAEIQRRYFLAVEEWRARPDDRKHYGEAISWAMKLPSDWICVPEDVSAYIAKVQREAAQKQHEKALKALAEAQELLAKATGGAT